MLETLAGVFDFWFWLLVPSVLVIGLIAALPTALLLTFIVKDTRCKDDLPAKQEAVQSS